jgi:hypothetical protein
MNQRRRNLLALTFPALLAFTLSGCGAVVH